MTQPNEVPARREMESALRGDFEGMPMTRAAGSRVQARVWRYPGAGGWYFLTVPDRASDEIKLATGLFRKAFGSVPVVATIGRTSWNTSIFPGEKSHNYVLPVKAEVRKKEDIEAGDTVRVHLQIHPRGIPAERP